MLWVKVKVGESVNISGEPLTLLAKNETYVVIEFGGMPYTIPRNIRKQFPNFVFVAGSSNSGLRLGFEAPEHILIRREKLEVKFPAK